MKKICFALVCLVTFNAKSQFISKPVENTIGYNPNYDRSPIRVLSIEKSLNNLDYFRMIMLDNNFQLDTESENIREKVEFWHVLENKNYVDSLEAKFFYGIANKDDPDYNDYPKWKKKFESIKEKNLELVNQVYGKRPIELPEAISYHWHFIHNTWGSIKEIRIAIRKDVLPEYKKEFESQIRANYTIKRVTVVPANKNEQKHYQISYYRKGSNVEVTMDDSDDIWFRVEFSTTKF